MQKPPISIRVQAAINEVLPATNDLTITSESTLTGLGLDSLDLVELAIELETQFGIEIDEENIPATFGGLVAMIESQTNG